MKKLDLLRSHLLSAITQLNNDPARLLAFVESGTVRFRAGDALSHEYVAPCRIVILEYSGSLDAITVPLCAWLAHYQPDLAPEAIKFDAEILANGAWDLSLLVPLSERVIVHRDHVSGILTTEHRLPEFPRDPSQATTWQLYATAPGDSTATLIGAWDDPGGAQ